MSRSRSPTVAVMVPFVAGQSDVSEPPAPVLTEQSLADPDESFDAAMDYLLPCGGSPEILRQAQRRLLTYIGWLMDEAPAQHPSWAKDELQRAVRRLVEVEAAAAKSGSRTLH